MALMHSLRVQARSFCAIAQRDKRVPKVYIRRNSRRRGEFNKYESRMIRGCNRVVKYTRNPSASAAPEGTQNSSQNCSCCAPSSKTITVSSELSPGTPLQKTSMLVVGATGTLGKQVVRHALDSGYEVRCLVRPMRTKPAGMNWQSQLLWENEIPSKSFQYYKQRISLQLNGHLFILFHHILYHWYSNRFFDWLGCYNCIWWSIETGAGRSILTMW